MKVEFSMLLNSGLEIEKQHSKGHFGHLGLFFATGSACHLYYTVAAMSTASWNEANYLLTNITILVTIGYQIYEVVNQNFMIFSG